MIRIGLHGETVQNFFSPCLYNGVVVSSIWLYFSCMDDSQRAAAIAAFKECLSRARTQTAFAAATGLLQQTVSNLLKRGEVLPAEAVIPAERAYGVSRHILRPDIYPIDDVAMPYPVPPTAVVDGTPPGVACDRGTILDKGAQA